MFVFLRKWWDRAFDIASDFDYKDCFWCEMFVFALGVLFGFSSKKAMKFLAPLVFLLAAVSAFEIVYPRRETLRSMFSGKYEDRFVEFSDIDDVPDFI